MTDIRTALLEHTDMLAERIALPPASLVLRDAHRRRRRNAAVVAAGAVAVIAAAGAAGLPDLPGPQRRQGTPAAHGRAPAPDEQRLRAAFGAAEPPVVFATVRAIEAADHPAGELGTRARHQAAGVEAANGDASTSVTWAVVEPALDDTEGRAAAGTAQSGSGAERGVPVPTGTDQTGEIRSAAYRFGGGALIRIWAWSADGGVVTVTTGRGAAATDAQVAALENAARSLLA
jgi:hypothetical protein